MGALLLFVLCRRSDAPQDKRWEAMGSDVVGDLIKLLAEHGVARYLKGHVFSDQEHVL